jgi:hypothetical protein
MIPDLRTQAQSSRTPIFVHGRPKPIGFVAGETFHKTVSAHRHFLRTPRAIALDLGSLEQAERAGARFVLIHDSDSGNLYRASCGLIRERGFSVNRGFGAQVALQISEWNSPADTGLQLTLFEGVSS